MEQKPVWFRGGLHVDVKRVETILIHPDLERIQEFNFDEFPIQCYMCDTVQAPDCAILKFEIREFYICKSCPHSHMIIVHCVKSGIWTVSTTNRGPRH